MEKIKNQLMVLFEQSVGMKFRVKGTPLVDEITGVDWGLMMVKGKLYGNFAVDLCELANTEENSNTN